MKPEIKTFKTHPIDERFILTTKNFHAAQNVHCLNCGEPWKLHFAGKSNTIPQGACLSDTNVIYSQYD